MIWWVCWKKCFFQRPFWNNFFFFITRLITFLTISCINFARVIFFIRCINWFKVNPLLNQFLHFSGHFKSFPHPFKSKPDPFKNRFPLSRKTTAEDFEQRLGWSPTLGSVLDLGFRGITIRKQKSRPKCVGYVRYWYNGVYTDPHPPHSTTPHPTFTFKVADDWLIIMR